MSEPRFVHLRIHSDYSMVDGVSKVPPLVKKVAEMGMPAMALTDFSNLCGLVKFYNTANNVGVKPIIGADFNIQSDAFGDELCQLTLLATNKVGYKNLTLLISKAYLRGHVQHRPVIDQQWLIDHAEGLIVLSGGCRGDLGRALLKGNQALAEQCAHFYQRYFPNAYYMELVRTGREDEESTSTLLWTLRPSMTYLSWRLMKSVFSHQTNLMLTKFASRFMMALRSMIRVGPNTTVQSSICALSKKCVSCLRIFPRH